MEKEVLEVADLVVLIRNLIRFIVVEGKEFVNDEDKEAYINQYMNVLISNINLTQKTKEIPIMDAILEDVFLYMK